MNTSSLKMSNFDSLKIVSLKSMLYVLSQINFIPNVRDDVNGYRLNVTDIQYVKGGLDNRYTFRIFSCTPCGYATRITDVRIIIDNEYLRNTQQIPLLGAFAYLHGMGEVDDKENVVYEDGSQCKFNYGNHFSNDIKINFETIGYQTYY